MDYKVYRDEGFHSTPAYLSNEIYAQALTSFTVVCVDVVPIDQTRKIMYLAPRQHKPAQGWWFIGGRVFAGEMREEAMRRVFKRETSLEIQPNRFVLVSMNRYFFKDREQEPQNIGCDTLAYAHVVELSDQELAKIKLDKEEYKQGKGLEEFDLARLRKEGVHQAMVDLYNSVFGTL